jgi:hypothetical protein
VSASRGFALVPRLETYPRLVRFAQTAPGKLVVLGLFACGLWMHGRPWWLEMSGILALLSFFPTKRRWLLFAGTSYWVFAHSSFHWSVVRDMARVCGVSEQIDWRILKPAAILSALVFCFGFTVLLGRMRNSRALRHPIMLLLGIYLALSWITSQSWLDGVWRVCTLAFLLVLGRYLWFVAYSAIYPGPSSRPLLTSGQYLPFWLSSSSSACPLPKAAGYLDKIEVKHAEELAICQLKALKLLWWAGILLIISKCARDLCDGKADGPLAALGISLDLNLPSARALLESFAAGQTTPALTSVLSLIAEFINDLLFLSVWGHVIIACCRASGFKALRNTYRPLESTSIADFWNRYYFYFKELLVDVFFYPTYMRYFKAHPRLRRFAATLAAATFGNFLYHYLRELQLISLHGPWGAALQLRTYMFHCVVLGLAIGVSQLRARPNVAAEHWIRRRVWRPAVVLGFYCLLMVFAIPGAASLTDRLKFLVGLSGINLA